MRLRRWAWAGLMLPLAGAQTVAWAEASASGTVLRRATLVSEGESTLDGTRSLSGEVSGSARRVALTLHTDEAWAWPELPSGALRGREQTVNPALDTDRWKSARTGWKTAVRPESPGQTGHALPTFSPNKAGEMTSSGPQWSTEAARLTTLVAQAAKPAPVRPSTPAASTSTRPFTTLTLSGVPAQARQGQPVTLRIETDGRAKNPFDPAQIDLWLRVGTPSGKAFRVPAYYSQDLDEQGQPRGEPGWRARVLPLESGTYTVTVQLGNGAVSSAPAILSIQAAPTPGVIGVSRQNPRLFAYPNGDVFVPIGLNIAWSGPDVLGDYTRWFDALSKNGGNFARVWMPAWGLGLEWKDTGLGDYTGRLREAALLDRVFELAAARGIQIELCLINHGQYSERVNPEWKDNPYNAANGGPLKTPGELVTNAQARELFKRRLRYIAARYSAWPNLFAWEYWNEVNWTPIADSDLKPWIADMTAALRSFDPYGHLVSTSYSGGAEANIWTRPELDFAQQHLYTNRELPLELTSLIRQFRDTVPDPTGAGTAKPVLLAELGYSAGGSDAPLETERTHLHTGLWAPLFLGYAGGGAYWWWDTLVGPKNLWGEYRGLSTFLKGQPLASLRPVNVQTAGLEVEARALRSAEHALVWLVSDQYSAAAAGRAYTQALLNDQVVGPDWKQTLPERRTTLIVRGLNDGAYTARWFDPQAGRWLSRTPAHSDRGVLRVRTPGFTRDLALVLQKA